MSLIKCDECGKDISSEADNCPNCGKPSVIKIDRRTSISRLISLLLPIVLFLGLVWFVMWSHLPAQLLIGKWQQKQSTIELLSDGVVNIKSGSTFLSGTYKIVDLKTAKVNLNGLGALFGTVMVNYEVTVDKLTIKYGNTTETYNRTTNPPIVVILISNIIQGVSGYIKN